MPMFVSHLIICKWWVRWWLSASIILFCHPKSSFFTWLCVKYVKLSTFLDFRLKQKQNSIPSLSLCSVALFQDFHYLNHFLEGKQVTISRGKGPWSCGILVTDRIVNVGSSLPNEHITQNTTTHPERERERERTNLIKRVWKLKQLGIEGGGLRWN